VFYGKTHLHSVFQNFGLHSLTFNPFLITRSERESDHARVLAHFRLSTRKIPRCAGLVLGNITALQDETPCYWVEMVTRETCCLHLHADSYFVMKMEAVHYFETLTGLYQITVVTMLIVSYLDLLHVLRDSFFCSGETPAPVTDP